MKEEYKNWKEQVYNKQAAKGLRKEEFKTTSDIEIKELYTPEDIKDIDYKTELGYPGEEPYTRGVQGTMYRGRLWTMRQYAGFGSAKESNQRYKYLLEKGQTGLSIAFDLPTQMGYDSDDKISQGEVGKVGVAIDTLEDMRILFDGINLGKVSTSMTINSTASVLLAMYIAVAKEQNVGLDKISGTIQNDILKEYVARGTYIFPPEPSLKIIMDIFSYCSCNVPRWNTISVSGYHIREAGASAVQEIAFTLADGLEYLKYAKQRGLDIERIAQRISFFFNAHNNFLEEIAKFRAARRLWAKLLKEKFNIQDKKALRLRFHTQTGGSTLTAAQPLNNSIRVSLQALAAVLGGTQSLHTNSYDEALCLPTESAVSLALRTQQIIAYESGAADTIDPLAGSYFIESLTSTLEEKAIEYIKKIENLGGMVKAIETGYVQKEIQRKAYEYQKAIEEKKQIIVGVNEFKDSVQPKIDILKISEELETQQISNLKKVKKNRDNKKVENSLKELKYSATKEENLMPVIIESVENMATLGEICNVLREVYGEYKENFF